MTPYERYWRRRAEEVDVPSGIFRAQMDKVSEDIEKELKEAQSKCDPHQDDGGMFEGQCEICGLMLG